MTALFDMDGTLFAGDSQLRFARWVLRRHGLRRLYLLLVLPGLMLRAAHLLTLEQMKRLFLSYAWRMPMNELQQECEAFVQQELLPAVFPELLERLRAHRQAGDTTVLCSASPDWWTQLMGQALGFSITIGTPVTTRASSIPLMPTIPPPGNNKGHAKLTRLAARGIARAEIAYTDSAADLPMLSIASKAVLVNPSRRFIAKAVQQQGSAEAIEVIRTTRQRPAGFTLRCLLGV